MKIIHVLASDRFSGAENVVCQIINMFKDDKEYEFYYCSPDGQIRESLKERNISFIPIDKLNVSSLKKVFHDYCPDIIHAHDMRASFITALSCGKIPFISHIHNNNFDSRRISIKSIAYFYAALKAKHIFYVSKSSYDGYIFSKYFKIKSSILYNIINITQLNNYIMNDDKIYNYEVVFLGRLTYQKNPFRFIDICNIIIQKNKNIHIAIIGNGELYEDVKKYINERKLDNNIHMLGFQKNPYKILQSAKVMLMSSRWEGTPMCALEALALGVPVVCTPVDGLKDIIKNGETGFVSNDNDIISDMILKIIGDDELFMNMKKKCIEFMLRYNDINEYKFKLINIYCI